MGQNVFIKSGEQTRTFGWGNALARTTTIGSTQASLPIYKESVYSTFQAILNGTGAVTATVIIDATNDDDTGRGVVLSNSNGVPGALVGVTNTSDQMTSGGKQFTAALIGKVVSCQGVPVGTTVSAVAAGGASLTLSAAATATYADTQCNFYNTAWIATVLGTITLTGTTQTSDGFTTTAPWKYVRARVTAITGTSAAVKVLMGV